MQRMETIGRDCAPSTVSLSRIWAFATNVAVYFLRRCCFSKAGDAESPMVAYKLYSLK